MIRNPLTRLCAGLLLATGLIASPVLAQDGYVEKQFGIVQAVNPSANTIVVKGHEYAVTSSTQVLNEVGTASNLRYFKPMKIDAKGLPKRDSGTKVYMEADYEHNLLKLQMVEEIPH